MTYYAGGDLSAVIVLDNDVSAPSTTPVDVPGLSFQANANSVHVIGFMGSFTSSATTVGIGLLFVAPAGSTVHGLSYHLGSTAQTMTTAEQMASGALTNAGTIGVRAANQIIPVQGWWLVVTGGTPGEAKLQLKAEVAGTIVLKAKSGMMVWSS